ncbi:hypothetical protein [uncultured Anaerococcus sp.]|uniref:hypothetical protein n=1 Tax=Anaerococcus sp. AH8042_DFU013_CI05 TaxID=3385202 RepID=UPI0025DE4E5E|nr:hypothetical protein [uncultured Anaerococcus sp.]
MTPIIHEKNNYKQIYDSLLRISNLVTRDGNSWSLRIKDISEEVPNKINDEFDFEIREILNNIHYSNQFFAKIKGKEWLSKEIVVNETGLFIKFCYDKNFILNYKLQIEIIKIMFNQNTKLEKIEKLVNLIDFNNLEFMSVKHLLDICYLNMPKLDFVASKIYSSSLSFILNKKTIISEEKIDIDFKFDNYESECLWNKYKLFSNKYYINILNSISNQLYNLKRYKTMGFNIEEFDFISFYPRFEEYISNLQQFIVIFKELLLCMDNKDKEY